MPSRILPLSQDAISRIHSSKQITSLSGVVLALLQNSLDAGSTKIDVSVNFGRGSCTVEDNGAGIPHVEFLEDGGLGKMHHTSKATSEQALHGSTGTYIASLAALSLLHITSQHSEDSASSTISIHQGRVISRQIPSHPSNELAAFGTRRTRVIVNDLFGNMPVRVKQRALTNTTGSNERSWVELKRDVAALLLAWKTPCSIKLRDFENQGRSLTLTGSHHNVSSSLTEKNLNQLQGRANRYDLRDAFSVVFQAGLAPFETRGRWVPVSASAPKLSCRGMICLDPAPTRLCQFVSIGIHPYLVADGHITIYDAINKIFSDSSFGTVEQTERLHETDKIRFSHDTDAAFKSYKQRQTRTSKGVDRWPMFIMQLEVKDGGGGEKALEHDDNHLKAIIEVLEAVMKQWLTANNFRPRQKRKPEVADSTTAQNDLDTPQHSADEHGELQERGTVSPHFMSPVRGSGSPRKRQRMDRMPGDMAPAQSTAVARQGSTSDIAHLSKIRSAGRDTHNVVGYVEGHRNAQSLPASRKAQFTLPPLESGTLGMGHKKMFPQERASSEPLRCKETTSSDDYGSVSDTDLLRAAALVKPPCQETSHSEDEASTHSQRDHDHAVDWQDPITKEWFRVNSRTGIVLPAADKPLPGSSTSAALRPKSIGTASTRAGRPLTLAGRAISMDRQNPDRAVPTFLRDWQNPVFELQTEQRIPVASNLINMDLAAKDHGCGHNNASNYFSTSRHGGQSKLSKASLKHLRIIKQVDAKFILCIIPGEGNMQNLVLVDQHAASERIILESLFKDLCSPIVATSPAARFRTNTDCVSHVATTLLEQPIVFEITAEESRLFHSDAQHFARYGILYDLHTISRRKQTHSLATHTLPPGISERCRLFPKLLIDLLRSEIWSRVEAGKQAKSTPLPPAKASNADHPWLDRIGSCPKGLLDMLNSRACRSAVMFNDVLCLRDCEDLLGRLSTCAFPFMCAHGRVSMVPVGEIGEDGVVGHVVGEGLGGLQKEGGSVGGFGGAWRRWKGGEA